MSTKRAPRSGTSAGQVGDEVVAVTNENFEALLLESAGQALAIARGEAPPARQTVRTRTAREARVRPAAVYTAERVKRVRRKLKLSQPVFAEALNVSPATVRAWEQGARTPEGPSRRLLEVAERHPDVVLGTLTTR